MRLASGGWWTACALALTFPATWLAAGCTVRDEPHRDAAGVSDATIDAPVGMDSGGRTCTTDPQCDDGFPCTLDMCVAGNVCDYVALDSMCADGERCVVGRGCVSGTPSACTTDAECDDGVFCNGTERCLGPAGAQTCVAGSAFDCDDGNACTTDTCDEAAEGCTYMPAPGCDAGVVGIDGGVPCDTFSAADYPGTYSFRPSAVAACGTIAFNVSEVTFSATATTLTVRADRFTLTQSPVPTDGTFDVQSSDGCATVRLQGMFTCADRWTGTWTASFGGGCSCAPQNISVRGSRR